MNPKNDRRAHRRLSMRLPAECHLAGVDAGDCIRGITRNVGSGGCCLELGDHTLRSGDRVHIELTIPPSEGVWPYQGRAACDAEILRVERPGEAREDVGRHHGVATRFLGRLRFAY